MLNLLTNPAELLSCKQQMMHQRQLLYQPPSILQSVAGPPQSALPLELASIGSNRHFSEQIAQLEAEVSQLRSQVTELEQVRESLQRKLDVAITDRESLAVAMAPRRTTSWQYHDYTTGRQTPMTAETRDTLTPVLPDTESGRASPASQIQSLQIPDWHADTQPKDSNTSMGSQLSLIQVEKQSLQEEIKRLQSELAEYRAHDLEKCQQQKKSLEKTVERLSRENITLQESIHRKDSAHKSVSNPQQSSRDKSVRSELQKLRSANAKLREDNQSLKSNAEQMKVQLEQTQHQTVELHQILAQTRTANSQLRDKLVTMSKVGEPTTTNTTSDQKLATAAVDTDSFDTQLKTLSSEKQSLETELAATKQELNDLMELRKQDMPRLDDMMLKHEHLMQKFNELALQLDDNAIGAVRQENVSLTDKLNTSQKRLEQCQSQLHEQQQRVSELSSSNKSLATTVSQLQKELSGVQAQLLVYQQRASLADELQSQLDDMTTQYQNLHKLHGEQRTLEIQEHSEKLSNAVSDSYYYKQQMIEYKTQQQQLQQQLTDTISRHDAVQQRLHDLAVEHEQLLAQLEKQYSDSTANKATDDKITTLNADRQELKNQIVALETQLAQLQARTPEPDVLLQLSQLRSDNSALIQQTAALDAELQHSLAENDSLRKSLDEWQRTIAELQAEIKRADACKAEIAKLKQYAADLESMCWFPSGLIL